MTLIHKVLSFVVSVGDVTLQEVPASKAKPNGTFRIKASRKTQSCDNTGVVSKHVMKH